MDTAIGGVPVLHNDDGGNDSFNEEDEEPNEEEDSFASFFDSFSRQWLNTQLTHHVSLAASNAFWKLSFNCVPKLVELQANEQVKRKSKIPQFLQVRKNLHKDLCPDINMTFAFLNKEDQSIIHVNVDHTPVKEFENNPKYQKLYEEAHIEVRVKSKS